MNEQNRFGPCAKCGIRRWIHARRGWLCHRCYEALRLDEED